MPRPVSPSKSLTAADSAAVCAVQALGAAGNLIINGTLAASGVATLDTQRRVLITSVGNDSGITFTVYGTNDAGVAISEPVVGANAGSAYTKQDFKTVTQVTGSGAAAGNVSVGTNSIGGTPWFVPDQYLTPFEVAFGVNIVSGAANWSIEGTYDDVKPGAAPFQAGFSQTPPVPTPFGLGGLTGVGGNAQAIYNGAPLQAWRLTINSGTGNVKATATQSGISAP